MNTLASVIIPTRHRPEMLAACLERLAPQVQCLEDGSYEVVVTDDGTATAASVVAAFPFARWVEGPRRGPAANRNNGAAASSGTWLLFLDDDCVPEPGWLKGYFHAFAQKPEVTIFEGRTFADRPQRSLEETAPLNESGGALWSCNLAVRRDVFESLGRFDERFPYATLEDMELRLRIQKAGVATKFVPEAAVCHPWRMAPQNWKPFHQFRESFEILLDIHPDQLERYPPGAFLRGTIKAFFRDSGPKLFKYRSGVRAVIRRHVGEVLLDVFVTRRYLARSVRDIRRRFAGA